MVVPRAARASLPGALRAGSGKGGGVGRVGSRAAVAARGGGRRWWRRPQWRPTRRAPGEIASRVEGELEAEGGGRVLNGEGVGGDDGGGDGGGVKGVVRAGRRAGGAVRRSHPP